MATLYEVQGAKDVQQFFGRTSSMLHLSRFIKFDQIWQCPSWHQVNDRRHRLHWCTASFSFPGSEGTSTPKAFQLHTLSAGCTLQTCPHSPLRFVGVPHTFPSLSDSFVFLTSDARLGVVKCAGCGDEDLCSQRFTKDVYST